MTTETPDAVMRILKLMDAELQKGGAAVQIDSIHFRQFIQHARALTAHVAALRASLQSVKGSDYLTQAHDFAELALAAAPDEPPVAEGREAAEREKFGPLGDNHHNAMACPYCNPDRLDPKAARAAGFREGIEAAAKVAESECGDSSCTRQNGECMHAVIGDPCPLHLAKSIRALSPEPRS